MKYAITRTIISTLISVLMLAAPPVMADRTVSETRDARPDGRVSLQAVTGHYRITGSNDNRLEITGTLGTDVEELEITGGPEDWKIKVRPVERSGWFRGAARTSSKLEIRVPRGVELEVSTVSAGLEFADLAGPRVTARTVSGDARLNNVRPERLELETVSGGVSLDAGGSLESAIKSVSGNLEASGLSGRLRLKSVSGNLDVSATAVEEVEVETLSGSVYARIVPEAASRLNLSSHSGDLRLVLPADTTMDFRASTFSGRIHNEFGGEVMSGRGPGERMEFRSGAGNVRIEAQSFSGQVKLERADRGE